MINRNDLQHQCLTLIQKSKNGNNNILIIVFINFKYINVNNYLNFNFILNLCFI